MRLSAVLGKAAVVLATHPRACCVGWALFAFSLGAISVVISGFKLQSGGLDPASHIEAKRFDAWETAGEDSAAKLVSKESQGLPQQGVNVGSLVLVFASGLDGDGEQMAKHSEMNVLAPPLLDVIRKMEQDIVSTGRYEAHCLREQETFTSCERHMSVTSFLFGNLFDRNVTKGNTTQVVRSLDASGNASSPLSADELRDVFSGDRRLFSSFLAVVGKDFSLDSFQSNFARTIFSWGGPLEGYDDIEDRELEQIEKLELYAVKDLQPIIDDVIETFEGDSSPVNGAPFTVLFAGIGVSDEEVLSFIIRDGMFSLGSTLFVFLFMWLHTGSLFLAAAGVSNILLSFPLAFFIFRQVLQEQMRSLYFMSVFVMLGIGADDVFIAVDTWKQWAELRADPERGKLLGSSLKDRAVWSYNRAMRTMFVTTFTTATSFLAAATSVLPAMRGFGIFAATIVMCNYFLIATYFFAALCVWDRWFGVASGADAPSSCLSTCCGVCGGGRNDNSVLDAQSLPHSRSVYDGSAFDPGADFKGINLEEASTSGRRSRSAAERISWFRRNGMAGVLREYYAPFVNRYRRWFIGFFTLLVAVSIAFAVQIRPKEDPTDFLPKWSNLEQFRRVSANNLRASAQSFSTTIAFVWGIALDDPIDRSKANKDNVNDPGEVNYDTSFDLASDPSAQAKILSICEELRSDGQSEWVSDRQVDCWLADFREHLIETSNFTLPALVERSFLISNLGAFLDSANGAQYKDAVDPVNLEWCSISFISKLPPGQQAPVIRTHFEYWDAFVEERKTADFAFYHTSDEYLDMLTDENLVQTAILGMGISVCIAFVCLLATTQNYVLSGFATLTILGIVASLLGVLVIFGWGLGLMESLNLAVVVGISVDYSVHLANHYRTEGIENPTASRYDKTRNALWGIGGSIFSGALTTLGASSMLFFAFITFSVNFGSVIFVNIFLSMIYTYGLFVPLLLEWGPERSFGEVCCCCANDEPSLFSESASVELARSDESCSNSGVENESTTVASASTCGYVFGSGSDSSSDSSSSNGDVRDETIRSSSTTVSA